ncbi:FG-GAP repeat domain-containing protein [Glaciecola siphonariae]|uniref:FG-GAP repeat domain-containing protein n=1 Tax=Glaciecola siphonariae TaxID=521012 RepID=A0ABV9M0V5_9ALTE
MQLSTTLPLIASICLLAACQPKPESDAESTSVAGEEQTQATEAVSVAFEDSQIVADAKYFWAHTAGDVSGDGLADLVFINNNASGGALGYYKGQLEQGLWEKVIIAQTPPTGGLFAGGDLEVADIDQDGDMDVVGIKHPGEWTDASATAEIFWYENNGSNWQAHYIGDVPDAVKDVSFADFDKDGLLDVALLTFDSHSLSIFKQKDADDWSKVQFIQNDTLHEGMDVGDFNGDGYLDIVANAYVFYNPDGVLDSDWEQINLNERWNNQTGDWSRNGTKTFVVDTNGDALDEIFLCHSERAGYPLVKYEPQLKTDGSVIWTESEILPEITACHTLQVYDFNQDGKHDILTGINFGRAVNLDATNFDLKLLLGSDKGYTTQLLHPEGIYNGFAIDFDGDSDMDFFRYPNHESTDLFLFKNQTQY